jgi:hypothetical protein
MVSWSGFGGDDDDCSTLTGSTLATAISPASASATVTGVVRPSLGATVVTTVNGQALTGTIFSAQGASTTGGTAGAALPTGQSSRNKTLGAFGAMVFAVMVAVCML